MEYTDYIKFFAALVLVLALMGGLSIVLKKMGLAGPVLNSGDKRRLKIIEILPLDARRKAVLLRRDEVEHLVILGGNGETVVETNIQSDAPKNV